MDNPLSSFKIISANVNGLGDKHKRQKLLTFWDTLSPDIICLCDTRLDCNLEQTLKNEANYNCYFNSLNSAARGVAILISKKTNILVIHEVKDLEGNMLILNLAYEQKSISLTCIYGPSQDSPIFFQNVFNQINNTNCSYSILCGDFNVTLNHSIYLSILRKEAQILVKY